MYVCYSSTLSIYNNCASIAGNGRNYLDDTELLELGTLSVLSPPLTNLYTHSWTDVGQQMDSLIGLLKSEILTDIVLKFDDGSSLKAHKIVLACRSSYFRELLSKTPDISVVELSVPSQLFSILVRLLFLTFYLQYCNTCSIPQLDYLYADSINAGDIPAMHYRLFIDSLVRQFCPEHSNRIAEHLLCARIHTPSSLSKDFEYAWQNKTLSDVTFNVSGKLFPAHKVVFLLFSCVPYSNKLLVVGHTGWP